MSKKEYQLWLMPVGDVTKAKCKICVKTFSLSNMGEVAVRSHASGKKHQTAVTLSQSGSVSNFFDVKCETTPGLYSTGKPEEPSTSSSHDAGHTDKESESMPTI